jgi:hypothetical protein
MYGRYAVSMRLDTVLMRLLFACKIYENSLFEALPNLAIKPNLSIFVLGIAHIFYSSVFIFYCEIIHFIKTHYDMIEKLIGRKLPPGRRDAKGLE